MEQNTSKCIIFDFDCTITCVHLSYLLSEIFFQNKFQSNPLWMNNLLENKITMEKLIEILYQNDWSGNKELIINILFGGIKRLNMIKKLLYKLKKSNFKIFISSKGNYDWICKALNLSDLYSFIDEINAVKNNLSEYNIPCVPLTTEGKFSYIKNKIKNYSSIYYVDDDNTEYISFQDNINSIVFPEISNFFYFGIDVNVYKKKLEKIVPLSPTTNKTFYNIEIPLDMMVEEKVFGLNKNCNGLDEKMINIIKQYCTGQK